MTLLKNWKYKTEIPIFFLVQNQTETATLKERKKKQLREYYCVNHLFNLSTQTFLNEIEIGLKYSYFCHVFFNHQCHQNMQYFTKASHHLLQVEVLQHKALRSLNQRQNNHTKSLGSFTACTICRLKEFVECFVLPFSYINISSTSGFESKYVFY